MWNWLSGRNRRLNPLENRLLTELVAQAPFNVREKLAKQIEAIVQVHRSPGGGESYCYPKNPKKDRDPALKFPCQDDEVLFARAQYSIAGDKRRYRAQFWAVRGWFFSIGFPKGAPPVKLESDVTGIEVEWKADLSASSGTPTLTPIDPASVSLPDWLHPIIQVTGVQDMKAPLNSDNRQKCIARVPSTLPPDYLELCKFCEGFRLGELFVAGLSEIYSISFDDTYFVIAGSNGGSVLAVKLDDPSGTVYFLEHSESKPSGRYASFQAAFDFWLTDCR